MKRFFYFTALAFLVFTCKDQHESERHSMLNERVGAQIPVETAKRWADRFDRRANIQNSRGKSDGPIASSYLYDYLQGIESKIGIGYHYGLDVNNENHLLVIMYDNEARWDDTVFDTKTKTIISKANAHDLCDRYKASTPEGPWSHFVGKNIIVEILQKPNFNSFEIIPGINDQDEKQLLLYVWLIEETSNGRTFQQSVEVYDKSGPCPAICPSE